MKERTRRGLRRVRRLSYYTAQVKRDNGTTQTYGNKELRCASFGEKLEEENIEKHK